MANDLQVESTMNSDAAVPRTDSSTDFVTIDVFYLLGLVWGAKFRILSYMILFGALLAGVSYTKPKLYESTLRFTPPQRTGALQLVSLSHSSGDEYRAMLTSDSVAQDVVEHQNLIDYFKVKDMATAKLMLGGMSKFTIDANNFVTIAVRSREAETSVRIANEYYAALYRLTERIAKDDAKHRLAYMSGPIEEERAQLFAAEDQLRVEEQKTGLVVPTAQASLGVQQIASLQDRISSLETQLSAALASSTEQNPQVVILRTQISNLRAQVAQMEGRDSRANSPGRLPELGLEVQRAQREVAFHTDALQALMKALATSSLQDSYTPSFSLIDPAIPHKNKVSPSRKLWLLAGLILGFLIGLLSVVIPHIARVWKDSAVGRRQLMQWRRGKASDARTVANA